MLHGWLDELGRLRKHWLVANGSEGVHVVPFCTTACVHSIHRKCIDHSIASLDVKKRPEVELISPRYTSACDGSHPSCAGPRW